MASYLITGGCGFIGSHLVDGLLSRGHHIRILDDLSTGHHHHPNCELIVGNVADGEVVTHAMTDMDGCFHLAAVASVARSNEEWLETHRINLGGAVAVFDAARKMRRQDPIPVVYASSAAVYGDNDQIPLDEEAETRPLTAYGADKRGVELHARVAGAVHAIPTLGLRFFNVYGPRQDPSSPYSGVISRFADLIRRQQPLTIHGDGLQVRDFIYVGDVVGVLIKAIDLCDTNARVFNVCTGQGISVLELAETLFRVTGRPLPLIHQPPRRGDIRTSIGSPARVEACCGPFIHPTALDDGLTRTLAALEQA